MLFVGERVDDVQAARRRRPASRAFSCANVRIDQGANPSLQVARDVLERLARAFCQLRPGGAACRRPARESRSRMSIACAAMAFRTAARRASRRAPSPTGLRVRAAGRPSFVPRSQQPVEIVWRQIEDREEVLGECAAGGDGPDDAHHVVYVRYSPLMRTYSALRSHVQIVAD